MDVGSTFTLDDLEKPDADEDLASVVRTKSRGIAKAEVDDKDDDDLELTDIEPVKSTKTRKSLVQASFESNEFDLDTEPQQKRHRKAAEDDAVELSEESSEVEEETP